MPRSRKAARLLRLAAMSSASRFPTSSPITVPPPVLGSRSFLGLFHRFVDRFDLVLHLPARGRHVDDVALLAAHERAPERRLIGKSRVLGIRLGRADDGKLVRAARARLFDADGRTEVHLVGDVIALIDYARVANHPFELEDAAFDEGLLLLGVLVFGIFGDVAEFFGLANSFVYFSPMDGLE